MRNYCTLFDSNYLTRGAVLYESLLQHSSEDFRLYVLAMDPEVIDGLGRLLNKSKLAIVDLRAFEGVMGLEELKYGRTAQEYCWTCASNLCEFLLVHHRLDEVTYLDADMMFFSDPMAAFDEISERSIAIVPHRLIPSKRHLEVNGRFNVSWVTFRNTPAGVECAKIWAAQCRERCSATIGCGDQLYLNDWPDKYGRDVCIFQNPGIGTAPWNLANYVLSAGPKVDAWPVLFYHFHEFQEREGGSFHLTNYELRPEDVELIYEPYVAAYRAMKAQLAC